MQPARASLIFLACALGGLMACGVFSWWVNPYGLWQSPGPFKPIAVLADQPRLYHPLRIAAAPYEVVILGSSRAREGFTPPAPQNNAHQSRFYNAGLSGASGYELGQFMEFIATHGHVKTVILGLDFFGLAPGLRSQDPVQSALLEGKSLWREYLRLVFSLETLHQSLKSVRKNLEGSPAPLPNVFAGYTEGNTRQRFILGLREHASGALAKFDPHSSVPDQVMLDEIAKGARALVAKGVQVNFVILPIPVERLMLIERMGLKTQYDAVFTALVHKISDLSDSEKKRIDFWDFGACSGPVNELAPKNDFQTMRWFYDANHFKPALGAEILKALSGQKTRVIMRRIELTPQSVFKRDWRSCEKALQKTTIDLKSIISETQDIRCRTHRAWCAHD
jgi:hypothetical protein